MPGDLYITPPFDFNQPDSAFKLVAPITRNLQVIATTNNSLNLQNIVKENGGLMGALNAMRVNLTAYEMQQIFPNAPKERREAVREQLNEDMGDYEIITNNRLAQLIGQVGEETGGLVNLREYFFYRDSKHLIDTFPRLFGQATKKSPKGLYADVVEQYLKNPIKLMGIIDYVPFYGRGLLQLTGEGNYTAFTTFYDNKYNSKIDFTTEQNRDLLVTSISDATRSALWYFQQNVIDSKNFDIDTASVSAVTAKINSGSAETSNEYVRETYHASALRVLKAGELNPFPKFKPTAPGYNFNFPPIFSNPLVNPFFDPNYPIFKSSLFDTTNTILQNSLPTVPYTPPPHFFIGPINSHTGFNTTPPNAGSTKNATVTVNVQNPAKEPATTATASNDTAPNINQIVAQVLADAVKDFAIGSGATV